jgi:hypothetical protein
LRDFVLGVMGVERAHRRQPLRTIQRRTQAKPE